MAKHKQAGNIAKQEEIRAEEAAKKQQAEAPVEDKKSKKQNGGSLVKGIFRTAFTLVLIVIMLVAGFYGNTFLLQKVDQFDLALASKSAVLLQVPLPEVLNPFVINASQNSRILKITAFHSMYCCYIFVNLCLLLLTHV